MFHFQDPVVDWSDCVSFLPNGFHLKAIDNVQMLDEAKRRKSTIKTILRHWYGAQVPNRAAETRTELGRFTAHADYLQKRGLSPYLAGPRPPKKPKSYGLTWLQVPGRSVEDNEQRARDFFDSFIDETFMRYAYNVDFVEEWNEYFGNNMPGEERLRFIHWAMTVARVWAEEYRTKPGLEHIRLILANTAVGNDIPVPVAQAAADYDALLGYHAYWPTRFNKVPADSWRWYEGRWAEMDANFISHGIEVEWALTEAGPVLYYGTWPRITLGPNDGWRHTRVHNAELSELWNSTRSFLDSWREWNSSHGGRCANPVLFTSGFSGWDDFQIHQPQLSSLGASVLEWSSVAPPPPPPPSDPPDDGSPRIQYPRVYNVLPATASKEQALAVFSAVRDRSLETVGYSYDDAGLGALASKTARLYGIPESKRQIYLDWYQEFYPGTHILFEELTTLDRTQEKTSQKRIDE